MWIASDWIRSRYSPLGMHLGMLYWYVPEKRGEEGMC